MCKIFRYLAFILLLLNLSYSIVITGCDYNISTPGVYTLNSNIYQTVSKQAGRCIYISVDNVLLDCNNYTIYGVNATSNLHDSQSAIYSMPPFNFTNITIRNCRINPVPSNKYNVTSMVQINYGKGYTFENVEINMPDDLGDGYGLQILNTDNITLKNVRISSNLCGKAVSVGRCLNLMIYFGKNITMYNVTVITNETNITIDPTYGLIRSVFRIVAFERVYGEDINITTFSSAIHLGRNSTTTYGNYTFVNLYISTNSSYVMDINDVNVTFYNYIGPRVIYFNISGVPLSNATFLDSVRVKGQTSNMLINATDIFGRVIPFNPTNENGYTDYYNVTTLYLSSTYNKTSNITFRGNISRGISMVNVSFLPYSTINLSGVSVYSCSDLIVPETYTIKENISTEDPICITISSNNTILKCENHSVSSSNLSIFISESHNSSISNCILNSSLLSFNSSNIYIENLSAPNASFLSTSNVSSFNLSLNSSLSLSNSTNIYIYTLILISNLSTIKASNSSTLHIYNLYSNNKTLTAENSSLILLFYTIKIKVKNGQGSNVSSAEVNITNSEGVLTNSSYTNSYGETPWINLLTDSYNQTHNLSYNPFTVKINKQGYMPFATEYSFLIPFEVAIFNLTRIINNCQNITEDITLSPIYPINATPDCFNLTVNGVKLDCNQTVISGIGSGIAFNIYANNTEIRNCIIHSFDSAFNNIGFNTLIFNNTITDTDIGITLNGGNLTALKNYIFSDHLLKVISEGRGVFRNNSMRVIPEILFYPYSLSTSNQDIDTSNLNWDLPTYYFSRLNSNPLLSCPEVFSGRESEFVILSGCNLTNSSNNVLSLTLYNSTAIISNSTLNTLTLRSSTLYSQGSHINLSSTILSNSTLYSSYYLTLNIKYTNGRPNPNVLLRIYSNDSTLLHESYSPENGIVSTLIPSYNLTQTSFYNHTPHTISLYKEGETANTSILLTQNTILTLYFQKMPSIYSILPLTNITSIIHDTSTFFSSIFSSLWDILLIPMLLIFTPALLLLILYLLFKLLLSLTPKH